MTVTLGATSLVTGQTTTASAVLRDAGGNVLTGRTVAWTSSAPSVATVSTTGSVSAFGAGTATILATSEGQSGSALLTVTQAPVASVAVSVTSPLAVGQTAQASAVLRDATGNVLTGQDRHLDLQRERHRLRVHLGPRHRGGGRHGHHHGHERGPAGTASVTVIAPGGLPTQMEAVSALSQTGPPASRWSRLRRSS